MTDAIAAVIAYHDRTKHQPGCYANGPHGLDWATQPNPFRYFDGAPLHRLPLAGGDDTPPFGAMFGAIPVVPRPFTFAAVGLFFELSMGLSARKEIADSSWFLRVNPSSGNLHPTEAYAILPVLDDVPGGAGVYHYAPLHHGLEQRARWRAGNLSATAGFYVALTSVVWREAWKYGERAFRYCQHDVGHALAALRCAAAVLGWRVQLMPEWDDARLARLLGLDRPADFAGAELETAELLVRVMVNEMPVPPLWPVADAEMEWFGQANRLSEAHVEWPVIDEVIAASKQNEAQPPASGNVTAWPPPAPPAGSESAGKIIRQRRSAVEFDGLTSLSQEAFLAILDATLPRHSAPPFDVWPYPPQLHLVLFVHRVTGLTPGLYVWLRAPADAAALRHAFNPGFEWEPVTASPGVVPLHRLKSGDLRDFARTLSCHQDIAADGAFSLGMLARFEPVLRERGAAAYRQLFWEAGLIGQALYLAAEAAGVRGTGIGCYFDDVLHQALGLKGHDWQSLYHFTVGGPLVDLRLRTQPPYAHLAAGAPRG